MGPAAGIVLAAGALTAANEAVFAPVAGKGVDFNWRVIPATGILALLMEGLSVINSQLATGISVSVLLTILFFPVGKAGSPVQNLEKAVGK